MAFYKTEDLPNLAAAKLLKNFRAFEPEDFNANDTQHVLAVWSSRVRLDTIIHSTEATKITDTAVASHMRILTGLSPERTYRYSCSPTEPILALGAATVLLSHKDHYPKSIDALAKELVTSYIDKGRFGETVARVALICARDIATIRDGSLTKPIPLLQFLNTLLGSDWGLHGMQKAEKEAFEESFCNSYVNFTHWTKTNDTIDRDTDM